MTRAVPFFTVLALASVAVAQPVIFEGGVRSAASYTPPGHLNSGLARGSLVVVFGKNLGRSASCRPPILFRSNSTGPRCARLGRAQLTVTARGQTSAPASIDVVQRNFGIFTLSQTGSGPAVVQNFETEARQPVNTILAPARPGQVVTLWGTGLGPVDGPESVRPLPGDLNIPLTVRIGFQAAKVRYKGRSRCCPGVDQIVFEVPQGIEGCYAPLVVVAGDPNRQVVNIPAEGAVSNTGTLAIASDGRCRDATGLTGAELDQLASGIALRTAAIQVESNAASATAAVRASFARLDTASMLRSLNILGLPPAGTCLEGNVDAIGSVPQIASPLDPGTLALSGPRGIQQVDRKAEGYYAADIPQALSAGSYTLDNGAGSAGIGAFRASFSLPNPVTWTNKSSNLGSNQHTS
ncbi:MAG: hypothetical protein EXQ52_00760 [Bryobacterales bacterium]|nr:hypothetical protein [Bryobacterales bacterium]